MFVDQFCDQYINQCKFKHDIILQGKIEAQGIYDDILKSGVDIASISNQKGENGDKDISNLNETIQRKQSHDSSLSINETSSTSANKNDGSLEETQLLKELEISSKDHFEGSVLLRYLKSANQTCVLIFLIASILITQILVSSADIWISYWYGKAICTYCSTFEPSTIN